MTSVLQTESEGSIPSGSILAAVAERMRPEFPKLVDAGSSPAGSFEMSPRIEDRGATLDYRSSILDYGWEAHLEERWCEAPEAVSSTLTPTTIAKWCNWQHARL